MTNDAVPITKDGLKKLEAELTELSSTRRVEIAEMIRDAQELGPDQLDGQYEDAKNQQAFLEGRIVEIERILDNAEVIDEKAAHRSKQIRIGSKVTVRIGKSKKSQTYQLVGPAEANPGEGRISHESPVGKALLDKEKGDKIIVETPSGSIVMHITTIS
jgi:transcription elongation factor GreA